MYAELSMEEKYRISIEKLRDALNRYLERPQEARLKYIDEKLQKGYSIIVLGSSIEAYALGGVFAHPECEVFFLSLDDMQEAVKRPSSTGFPFDMRPPGICALVPDTWKKNE